MSLREGQRGKGGYLFTSECVTTGHPDKLSDRISDAILDACLQQDKKSRVAVETLCTVDFVCVSGEVTTKAEVDYESVVRRVIKDVGYVEEGQGFNDKCEVMCRIHTQSPDIALGVDRDGAGDQGIMFGGACDETTQFMPLAISVARSLTNKLTEMCSKVDFIKPDGKSQVTIKYGRDNRPYGIDTVVVSVQHSESKPIEELREFIKKEVIAPVLADYGFSLKDVASFFINPTGKFVVGGPAGDTGLTGRKIIVDTYGGFFAHGGGAFSGKDPTKVDRSAAYMARYIAKNIVCAGLAEKVQIQLAYAIGVARPVSVNIKTFGTNKYPVSLISKAVYKNFDMTPKGMINMLGLVSGNFKYEDLAAFGHFGVNEDLPWEQTDKAQNLLMFCEESFIPRARANKQ